MKRRDLLQALAVMPYGLVANRISVAQHSRRPTVESVEVFRIRVNSRGNWTIVRVRTDGDVTGLGDASHGYGDAFHGTDDTVALGFIKEYAKLLRGHSVFDVAWFHQATAGSIVHNGTPAAVAADALEQCLWDIQGKVLSVPTYDLFGGRIQERITLYANINRSTENRSPDGFARMATRAIEAGFYAVKLAPFDEIPLGLRDRAKVGDLMQAGVRCAEQVRLAIGADRDLMIDAHSRFTLDEGRRLVEMLQPLNLYWIEEVTPANPITGLAAINKAAKMLTAGGESLRGVTQFYPYISAGAVDVVMPDVKVCGGMLELKKIAAIAEGAGLFTSPHGPASPVGNVAAAHVIASVNNFNTLELSFGEVPWRSELIDPPEEIKNGGLVLSERPGLGIALNEKLALKYAV